MPLKNEVKLAFSKDEKSVQFLFESDQSSSWYFSKKQAFDALEILTDQSRINIPSFANIRDGILAAKHLPQE